MREGAGMRARHRSCSNCRGQAVDGLLQLPALVSLEPRPWLCLALTAVQLAARTAQSARGERRQSARPSLRWPCPVPFMCSASLLAVRCPSSMIQAALARKRKAPSLPLVPPFGRCGARTMPPHTDGRCALFLAASLSLSGHQLVHTHAPLCRASHVQPTRT